MNYESVGLEAVSRIGIPKAIDAFVARYNLHAKKVLEVGSGTGYLQDAVDDYTGIDISPNVAHYYHKPFVVGSATGLPFDNNTFDAAWSIWVLEHIARPERAVSEIRRVVKPNGVIYLLPAWNCQSWWADGFDVRPYEDFNWRGKVVKASVPVRSSALYTMATTYPARAIRRLEYYLRGINTPFRFHRLDPNYDVYWRGDADAAVSLDRFELLLWFQSRGDKCLNCDGSWNDYLNLGDPLIIQIQK